MNSFNCYQTSPTSIHYKGSKTFKDGTTKVSEGDVRVTKRRYFDYDSLAKFAENAAYTDLNPVSDTPINNTWKGKHMGHIRGNAKCDRSTRKTHSERRAQIVARSLAANRG